MSQHRIVISLLVMTAMMTVASPASGALFKNPYNPIVTHMFTADPTARVFDGKLYIYPSSDTVCPEGKMHFHGYCMPGYNVFSTSDLTQWVDHGNVVNHNSVPWVKPNSYGMWAPDAFENDGKYYFYFPGLPSHGKTFRDIGVAVADKPEGPFTAEPTAIQGIKGIDPGLYRDDDGKVYLYYGVVRPPNQTMSVVELNPDMISVRGKKRDLEIIGYPGGYAEGAFVFQRNGTYYFTFPHAIPEEGQPKNGIPDSNESLAYAIGDSPFGPFHYKGLIMDKWKECFTNHHSIVNYQEQWFIFYHSSELSGDEQLRSMAADRLYFNEDGSIKKVTPTGRGIGYVSARETLQIDRFSSIEGAEITKNFGDKKANWAIFNIEPNATVAFNQVDFGNERYHDMVAMVRSKEAGATITVLNEKQREIASFDVPATHNGQWQAIRTKIAFSPKKNQNLRLRFTGNTDSLQLDWVKFLKRDETLMTLAGGTSGEALFKNSLQLTEVNSPLVTKEKNFQLSDIVVSRFDATHTSALLVNGKTVTENQEVKRGSVVNISLSEPSPIRYSSHITLAKDFDSSNTIDDFKRENLKHNGLNVPVPKEITDGTYITFNEIVFDDRANEIKFAYSAGKAGGRIEVREGSNTGELLATIQVDATGTPIEWVTTNRWRTKQVSLDKEMVLGKKQITFVFKGDEGMQVNFGWFKFIGSVEK